jgi:hypothetical protein
MELLGEVGGGWTENWEVVELAVNETSWDGAANAGEVLESGGESIKLGDCGCGTENSGSIDKVTAEPEESLSWPYGRMLWDVLVGS